VSPAWRPPRLDSDGVTVHADVAHAAEYSIETPLYVRTVGNGTITCKLLQAPTPAKRIVQLLAEYYERGVQVTHVVQCASESEEIRELERLEKVVLEASRKPSG
jgi:hypothetical protein